MVFDTQDIIEKAHLGDLDYVNHALLLFTDFIAVFVRILIIMVSQATMRYNGDNNHIICCQCIYMWYLHGSICCHS